MTWWEGMFVGIVGASVFWALVICPEPSVGIVKPLVEFQQALDDCYVKGQRAVILTGEVVCHGDEQWKQ